MKKILLLLIIALFPIFVLAREYEAEDINLTLDINDQYVVLTRDNLSNNDNLNKLNVSREYIESVMSNSDVYMVIIKNNVSYEILVVVPETVQSFSDFDHIDDETYEELRNEFVKKTGVEVYNARSDRHGFIVADYYDKETGYYMINYHTVANYRGYNIQLQKKSEITDEEKQELKELVYSIKIKNTEDNESNDKKSFNYDNLIYGIIIGSIAGIITYYVDIYRRKRKASK